MKRQLFIIFLYIVIIYGMPPRPLNISTTLTVMDCDNCQQFINTTNHFGIPTQLVVSNKFHTKGNIRRNKTSLTTDSHLYSN